MLGGLVGGKEGREGGGGATGGVECAKAESPRAEEAGEEHCGRGGDDWWNLEVARVASARGYRVCGRVRCYVFMVLSDSCAWKGSFQGRLV